MSPSQTPAKPATSAIGREAAKRLDGQLESAMSGMGVPGVDVLTSVRRRSVRYSPAMARIEYRSSWAARREIDRPASDLIREGVKIEDLPPWVDVAAVLSYLGDVGDALVPEDRGVLAALSRLYGEANKLGGAALVLVIDDGLPPWMPLDLSRVKRLRSLELLERDEITPWSTTSGAPEHYIIGSGRTNITAEGIVHRTRVILSKGARLGPREEHINQGWGASALEMLQAERDAMHGTNQELASLALKACTDVAYLAELAETLCGEGEVTVDERIALMARSRGQHRVIPMDAGRDGEHSRPSDRFESIARPVEGLARVGKTVEEHWAAGTGQTPSIALGKNAGGLNTGANAGDWQSWGGHIGGEQARWLRPRFDMVLEVVFASTEGPTGGRVPETWTTTFGNLWKPSEKEIAETRRLQAVADEIYKRIEAVTADEIRDQRFIKGVRGEMRLEPIVEPDQPDAAGEEPEAGEQLGASGGGEDVSRQALNGAQITSLFELAANVTAGVLPIDTALWLIGVSIPGVDMDRARRALEAAANFDAPSLAEQLEPAAEIDVPEATQIADAVRWAGRVRKDGAAAPITMDRWREVWAA